MFIEYLRKSSVLPFILSNVTILIIYFAFCVCIALMQAPRISQMASCGVRVMKRQYVLQLYLSWYKIQYAHRHTRTECFTAILSDETY